MTTIGYIRVSTNRQDERGAGLEAQEQAIRQECDRRGWNLVRIEKDVLSGKSMNGRHGLTRALKAVESEEADTLMVAKLDRLGRSVFDVAGLIDRAAKQGWALVALDVGIDTSTIMGKGMAQMASVFAEMERDQIAQRIKDALAVKKAQGVELGGPNIPKEVRTRMLRLRLRGHSFRSIAKTLNKDGVPTARGGQEWYPATIQKALGQEGKRPRVTA